MKKLMLLLLVAVSASAYGQPWQLVNSLPAGRADDIAIGYTTPGNQQLFYITDQTSWPFKSSDGGASWVPLQSTPDAANPIAIIADPNNAANVWIARTGFGVYYSGNEGQSWEWRSTGLTNSDLLTLEMAPDNPQVIFAGCSSSPNVFMTFNGGANWAALNSPPYATQVFDIETPGAPYDVLLAACDMGLYKSTDYGGSWSRTWTPPARDIARDPNQPGWFYAAATYCKVLKSTDSGASWVVILDLSGVEQDPRKIAVSPSSRVYVATENAGVYWSDPPYTTWYLAGQAEGLYDKLATSIAVDARSSSFLLFGTRTWLYRSTDQGSSWASSVSGMPTIYPASFSSSLPGAIFAKGVRLGVSPDISGAGEGMTVYRSVDGGSNWSNIYSSISYEETPRGPRTLVAHPQDALRLHLAWEAGTDQHAISSTTDGGATWWKNGIGGACCIQSLAVDLNPEWAYLLNDNPDPYVWRTFDGGENWYSVNTFPPETAPLCATSFPAPSGTIFVGASRLGVINGIYRSKSHGGGWTQVGLNGCQVTSIALDNPNHQDPSIVYAGAHDGADPGVHKSTTDGDPGSWVKVSSGINAAHLKVRSLAVDPAEPAIVYAATHSGSPGGWNGHFYVSVDGAQQWTEIPGDPQIEEIFDVQMDYNQPDKVYVVTTDGQYDFGAQPPQEPKETGLFTYTPTWQFKPLTSASSSASDSNSQRKLVRQEGTSNLHAVYHSGNGNERNVYYVSSTDGGATWSRKILLGQGKFPAIALDEGGNPQVIWLSDNDNALRYAYRQGGVWSAGQTLYIASASDKIGPPAFCAVHSVAGSRGHVVFNWKSGSNQSTAVKYGWFTLNTTGTLQNVVNVDSGSSSSTFCSRPSLAYSFSLGSYYLHASWAKGTNVWYSYKQLDSGPWTNTRISQTSATSAQPNIEFYGDAVNVAWVQTSSPVSVINRYRTFPYGSWSTWKTVSQAAGCASPQMAAGSYCVWNEGDNEVYYAYRVGGVWQQKINWYATQERSVSPQVTFWPGMMGTTLFCFWTENNSAPYQEYFATTIGPLSGFFTLDAGQTDPSPYTVHRGGYLEYTQEPEKTVDTDGSYLTYRFDRLDPKMLYLVRGSYYQESGSPVGLEVKVDGSVFANLTVPNRSVIRGEAWVPSELYADSVVEITIRKKSGTLGTLGYLELCQAEPKGKGGPQSSELADLNLPKEFSLAAGYPNPMTSEARIDYALPKASSVDLTVYNISGQVVRQLVSEPSKTPGRYSVRWDGTNDKGHRVPAGVYFYRLNAGSFSETRKLVAVR